MPWVPEPNLATDEPFDDGTVFDDGTGFDTGGQVTWVPEPSLEGVVDAPR